MSSSLAELQAVSVHLGLTPVLRNLHLRLAPGASLGVMGPNGSGKTTLLRVLATLIPPSSGGGTVLGADVRSEDRFAVRPRIGMLGHVPALYAELTLRENTRFAAGLLGLAPEGTDEALAMAGLSGAADRRADRCSFGMQRRAELARIALAQPDLLLLDEPHAGLDPAAVDLLAGLVADVRRRGGGAVVVSHDAGRLASLVDEVVKLAKGRVALGVPS